MEVRRRAGLGYRSYLLRLWETTDGDRRVWRASLEQPGTGRRQGFAGLRELVAFLERAVVEETVGEDEVDEADAGA